MSNLASYMNFTWHIFELIKIQFLIIRYIKISRAIDDKCPDVLFGVIFQKRRILKNIVEIIGIQSSVVLCVRIDQIISKKSNGGQ